MKKVILISMFTVMSYATDCFVVNVASNDTLNVRIEAGSTNSKVGELAHDSIGVEVNKCKYIHKKDNWCHLNYSKFGTNVSGWVSAKYLEPNDSFVNLNLMASASRFNEPEPIVVEIENKDEAKIVKKESFIFIDVLTQGNKEKIQSFLNAFTKDIKIKIAGNTNASGKEEDNFALSLQKAKLTKEFLINELGYKNEQVITMGYGEKNPICKDEFSKQCLEINARVDIEVSGKRYLNELVVDTKYFKDFSGQIIENLYSYKKKQINIIYENLKSGRDSSVCASNKKSCKKIIKVNNPIISKDACKVVYRGEIERGSFMLSFDFKKGMGWTVPTEDYTNYIIFEYDQEDMLPGLNTEIKYDEGSYYIKLISFFDGFIERDFSAPRIFQSFRELHKVCYVK